MSDTELRDIPDFAGAEILFGQIPALPKHIAFLLTFDNTSDCFEQGALSTAGRADDRGEVPRWNFYINIGKDRVDSVSATYEQGYISEFKHRKRLG
jgi:hypothetical protein